VGCRRLWDIPFWVCVAASAVVWHTRVCLAQSTDGAPPFVVLAEASAVDVLSLPAESIVAPLLCDADGGVVFRLAMPDTGVEDPVAVSRNGSVVHFFREKINTISQPTLSRMFLAGDELYILVRGHEPLGHDLNVRTPSGDIQSEPASKASTFVAHFRRGGDYVGAVQLDLPFTPQQIGVFQDGDFLIAGIDKPQGIARAAIVGSNGQLRRSLELAGDVHLQETLSGEGRDPTALPRMAAPAGGTRSFFDVVSTSQIVQSGPELLLFRPGNGPIFSVSASGEVRPRHLKVKGKYTIFAVKPTPSAWIVEFMHDLPNTTAQEFSTYAFDPETGEPLREYVFDADLGWGLACTDGATFTFVTASEKTNSLRLITMAPSAQPKH
jgi:hypothetical protein